MPISFRNFPKILRSENFSYLLPRRIAVCTKPSTPLTLQKFLLSRGQHPLGFFYHSGVKSLTSFAQLCFSVVSVCSVDWKGPAAVSRQALWVGFLLGQKLMR